MVMVPRFAPLPLKFTLAYGTCRPYAHNHALLQYKKVVAMTFLRASTIYVLKTHALCNMLMVSKSAPTPLHCMLAYGMLHCCTTRLCITLVKEVVEVAFLTSQQVSTVKVLEYTCK
jgi:hypothetical protein